MSYLAWPVSINGKPQTREGSPFHLTLKWFPKNRVPQLGNLLDLLTELDLTPPGFRDAPDWKLEVWPGVDLETRAMGKFHVLEWKNPPDRIRIAHAKLDGVYGESGFPFRPHVTLPKYQYDYMSELGPGHFNLEFGQLALMGVI